MMKPQRLEIIYESRSYEIDVTNPSDTLHDIIADIYRSVLRSEMNLFKRVYADVVIQSRSYRLAPGGPGQSNLALPPLQDRYTLYL
jgi:hypothetical protein